MSLLTPSPSPSSSSSKPNFKVFTASQNPTTINKALFKLHYFTHNKTLFITQCSSQQITQALLDSPTEDKDFDALVVRRPVKDEDSSGEVPKIDAGLNEFAKKMPIFEPKRVESSASDKPLIVNLDLALYKAKNLGRNYRFQEAQEILEKVFNLMLVFAYSILIFLIEFNL